MLRGKKIVTLLCVVCAVAAVWTPAASAAKPKVSVANARVTEGGKLVFVVTASRKVARPASARFTLAPGTASATDYVSRSGRVTVKRNRRRAKIVIGTVEDTSDEPNEQFSVRLTRPRSARLGRARASGTIVDDDAPPAPPEPSVSFAGGTTVAEGNPANPGTANLQVVLSQPYNQPVSVSYSLTGGSAMAGDFAAPSGTVSIPAGMTSAPLALQVAGDFVQEGSETGTFTLANPVNATLGTASATVIITDDDPTAGDLVISEIMANPVDQGDAIGEYVEIYNASLGPVNLAGLELVVGATVRCTLTGTIASGEFYVASPDVLIRDTSCPQLFLLDSGTTVSVRTPSPLVIIDSWAYPAATAGQSRTLDPDSLTALGNDDPNNSCLSNSVYATTDRGTPGASNEQCP